jgi:hypothetical protein
MQLGCASLTRRSLVRPILAVLLLPSPAATGHQDARATATTLYRVDVGGTDDRLVITLNADGPISGQLQQAGGGTTRLFIDLHGVRPRVDAVTPVNRGPVLRIRVALHSTQPLVTRVVLDVSDVPPARIDRESAAGELRIVIGAEADAAATGTEVETPPAERLQQDRAWCRETADRAAALLEQLKPSTSQAEMLATRTAWEAFERAVESRTVAAPLQSVHHMLLQGSRLARIAAGYLQARETEQAAAALAGARLLLNTVSDRLAQ